MVFLVSLILALVPGASGAATPGSAGTDTALAPTDSAVEVSGRGAFADVKFTVNQTRDLTNQAISISWTGAAPTKQGPGRFGSNFMQIMQCWGDDDGTNVEDPGPSPERCEFGASTAVATGVNQGAYPNLYSTTRVISRQDWANYDANVGTLEPKTGDVWRPFKAVDGTAVGVHVNPSFNPTNPDSSYWLNPYFNRVTSNEIPAAVTGPDGSGSELFTMNTGLEAPGLGCGQRLVPAGGGATFTPKCWLVIVPRADPTTEDQGTPFSTTPDFVGVATSPLADAAWANRIAIPLDFRSVDSPCSLDADARRVVGSELIGLAMSSWQPSLCSDPGAPPFVYATTPDLVARQQIASPTPGSPGMAVVSKPLDASQADPTKPTVYAPLTLSGIVIGLNVERVVLSDAPAAEAELSGIRVANVNLTPRLVAKLLTQSYGGATFIFASPPYDWVAKNPTDIFKDPDFLRFNPEFGMLRAGAPKNAAGLTMPALNADTARQVWEWIFADPEAKGWLDGRPDEWGMRVNPVYATAVSANSTGVAFAADGAPDNYPKADPYCYRAQALPNGVVPLPLCGTDWMPYVNSFRDAAKNSRAGDDGAKTAANPFAVSADQTWKREEPQALGRRTMFAITDSASASIYGLQQAKLSRAGDNGDDRSFIAPDPAALVKGAQAMKPASDPGVLEADPAVDAPGAYPLAALAYGAVRPLSLDDSSRADYASFIRYAVGAGQEPGVQQGQLPPGYAPLPTTLVVEANAVADQILSMQAPPADSGTGAQPSSAGGGTGSSGSANRPGTTTRRPASTNADGVAEQAAAAADTGAAPAQEVGPLTPILALARSRFFIPALAALVVIASLIALEITKRPRRASGTGAAVA